MLCLQPGTGIATWLCDHLDHHLPILLGRIGPFAHRTETSTTKHEKPVQTSHRRDGGTSRTGLCQVPGHLNKIEHHVERCHRGLRFSQGIWLVTCRSVPLAPAGTPRRRENPPVTRPSFLAGVRLAWVGAALGRGIGVPAAPGGAALV